MVLIENARQIKRQENPFATHDIAKPEDLEAIRIADEEYARGEYVEEDAINWK